MGGKRSEMQISLKYKDWVEVRTGENVGRNYRVITLDHLWKQLSQELNVDSVETSRRKPRVGSAQNMPASV